MSARKVMTFKDEDEVGGVPVGPVMVIPFGADLKHGVEDLGWMSKPEALAEAERRGLTLEEA